MIVEPAPAKLNLALHVRGRRADGYHDIETVFAFCTDGDVVRLTAADTDSFTITGPFAGDLRTTGDNLVTGAARAFVAAFEVATSHRIVLEKNLPIASGIGGGSADAAATLRALARLHGVAIDDAGLIRIAEGLGADVPACLAGCAAFGTGRGDALVPFDIMAGSPVLLVNPRIAVSTAAVFAGWDGIDRGPLDPADLAAGRNDLAPSARQLAPAIGDVLAMLAAQPGATLVRMSGSGATCFAIFADKISRDAAAMMIRSRRLEWWQMRSEIS